MDSVHDKLRSLRELWFKIQQEMRDNDPCVYPVVITSLKSNQEVLKFDQTARECKIFGKVDNDWIPLYQWREEYYVRFARFAGILRDEFYRKCNYLSEWVDQSIWLLKDTLAEDEHGQPIFEPDDATGGVRGPESLEEASEIVERLGVVGLEQAKDTEKAPVQGTEVGSEGQEASGDKPTPSFVRWFEHRGYHGETYREMIMDFGGGEKSFYVGHISADGMKIHFTGNSEELVEADFRRVVDSYIKSKRNNDAAFVKRLSYRGRGANLRKSLTNGSYFFGEVEAPEFNGKIIFDGYTETEAEKCFRDRIDNYLDSGIATVSDSSSSTEKTVDKTGDGKGPGWVKRIEYRSYYADLKIAGFRNPDDPDKDYFLGEVEVPDFDGTIVFGGSGVEEAEANFRNKVDCLIEYLRESPTGYTKVVNYKGYSVLLWESDHPEIGKYMFGVVKAPDGHVITDASGRTEEEASIQFWERVDGHIESLKLKDPYFVRVLSHRGRHANLRRTLGSPPGEKPLFFGEVEVPEFNGKIVFAGNSEEQAEENFRIRVDDYLDAGLSFDEVGNTGDAPTETKNDLERKYWEDHV